MSNSTLPKSPLYDPKCKVRNFVFDEDLKNIHFNLQGSGLLYKDTKFFFHLEDDKEWRRPKEVCSRPIFINGKPDRFDALQGNLGNAWLVNGIQAITLHDKLIEHVVPPDQSFDHNYIGAFHFRIWQLGTWYDVVVDDRLPVWKETKKLCYVHSKRGDIFWAPLLEKAFAKFSSQLSVSYSTLAGGNILTSFQSLSGGLVEKMSTTDLPDMTLKWLVEEVFKNHGLMALRKFKNTAGLVSNQSYTVTKVFKCSNDDSDYPGLCLVRLLNPWGFKEWKGDWSDYDKDHWGRLDQEIRNKLNEKMDKDDGEFWMGEKDIIKYCEKIYVCHLGPGQYIESRHGVDLKVWRTTVFYGEWIKNISAGGAAISNRHKNPQYRMLMNWDESEAEAECVARFNVVIELSSWSKYGRKVKPKISFYVYSLTDVGNQPKPLDNKFFENEIPVNDNPDFNASDGRTHVESMMLDAGKYCIVPCTQQENRESQYLLRVFSESCEEVWEYDIEISKSLPTQEESMDESNEDLKRLFDDVAQGQDEIDWIGLKKILEKAMSSKKIFFGFISEFFKFIRAVFHSFISFQSSNDYEAGDVVFSKDECRSMIAMLDDNHSGKLSFSEFNNLWNKICFWTKVYEQHRDETEGYLAVAQLRDALSAIGYNVNKRTVHSLSYVYANDEGNILLTDFILCGVTLETVLFLHEKEHIGSRKIITFTLEEWVKHTLIL